MTKVPTLETPVSIAGGSSSKLALWHHALGQVCSFAQAWEQEKNEDSIAIIPLESGGLVLAVADGAGGLPAGEQASSLAIKTLIQSVQSASKNGNPIRGGILDAFEKTNESLLKQGKGSACTLSVCEISQDALRPYHVGDSEVWVIGQRGKIKYQTVSHSPVGYAKEAGLLSTSEAFAHDERHLVLNLLGTQDMHIDVGPEIQMAKHDTLLLASDGLYDNLTETEIVELLRKGALKNAVQRTLKQTLERMDSEQERGKPDDLGIIAFRPR